MRIIHLAAGAGGMYCGACTRDFSLARGLIARGHDVMVIPLYTPLRPDMPHAITATTENNVSISHLPIETDIPQSPIFLGGITAYLEQMHPLFQRMPSWLDRMLSSRRLLSAVSRFAVSIDPAGLGPMTYSVLSGKEGRQAIELDKLMDFLHTQLPIDLVSITNTLLSSAAPAIKQRLKRPVVCAFQGEDSFLDAMPEPWRKKSWDKLSQNCESIDIILSPGYSSIEAMQSHIPIDPEKIRLIRPGLDMSRYPYIEKIRTEIFTVGYLSAITPSKGLDVLVKAMCKLSQAVKRPVKLLIAGRILDPRFWKETERILITGNIPYEYRGEISFEEKIRFLGNCDAFVLPSRIPEARGMAAMEAMAVGRPAAVPNSGVFPELMEILGGGELFEPSSSDDLAAKLSRIAQNKEISHAMGASAREIMLKDFTLEQMCEHAEKAYLEALS